MKDLIRSPLQFVRRMTEQEWQELMMRKTHREAQRERRRLARQTPKLVPSLSTGRVRSVRVAQTADSSGGF